MNEIDVKQHLCAWILDRAKDRPDDLKDDTPILELGILSSLDVVELVATLRQNPSKQLKDGRFILDQQDPRLLFETHWF